MFVFVVQGWGLYSEDLGEDMEYYKDDMERLVPISPLVYRWWNPYDVRSSFTF